MTAQLFLRRTYGGGVSVAAEAPHIDDPSIAFGDTIAVFDGWGGAATYFAVWRREAPANVGQQLAELQLGSIAGWRRRFYIVHAGAVITEAMTDSGFRPSELASFLSADMALLSRLFADSTGMRHIEARLEIVRDDACRRFHVDSYPARLAVTYVGPGTVWVPRCHSEQALAEQADYKGPALEIPAFSVGLFAGEAAGRAGLVHRSPRLVGTGLERLFFCVNAAGH